MNVENPSDTSYVVTAQDFQFFGEAHNLGLQYIYDNYINNLQELPTEIEYDYNIFSLTTYFFNNEYAPTMAGTPILIDHYVNFDFDSLVQSFYSIEQQNIIFQIKEVFQYSTPLAALQELDIIDVAIDQMSDLDQKIQLWCMVAVARHSIQYWTGSQGGAWINKLNSLPIPKINNNSPTINDINWGTVAEKDWDGFVAGLFAYGVNGTWKKDIVVGAIRGALGGGLGAIGGAIINVCGQAAKVGIASACAASAGSIFYQLYVK